ncbi:MAG: hypothetical protein GY832_25090 [Chloroflexi bacterium]|nr:hypothetical protein [Chloroflexota bacterium]
MTTDKSKNTNESDKIRVCPFTVLIDQQEKAPYPFSNVPAQYVENENATLIVKTKRLHLKTGDYSIEDYHDDLSIERKSLEDFYMTLGNNTKRERFRREVLRLSEMKNGVVLIEATWPMICNPSAHRNNWQSRLNPRSVYGTILSWQRKYERVNWVLAGSRRMGETLTFHMLERFWEWQRKREKAANTK